MFEFWMVTKSLKSLVAHFFILLQYINEYFDKLE